MAQSTVNVTYLSTTPGIVFTPADGWVNITGAPGATNGQAAIDSGDKANGLGNSSITWTFPVPATGFQYWGYQRWYGGLLSICFDCPAGSTDGDHVELYNNLATTTSPPALLYSTYNLSLGIHNVSIVNLYDPTGPDANSGQRTGGYGQMSLDRFVLAVPLSSTATASGGAPTGTGTTPNPKPGSSTGAIVGGAVGGVVALVLIGLVLCWFIRRRRRNAHQRVSLVDDPAESIFNVPPAVPFRLKEDEEERQEPNVFVCGHEEEPIMTEQTSNRSLSHATEAFTIDRGRTRYAVRRADNHSTGSGRVPGGLAQLMPVREQDAAPVELPEMDEASTTLPPDYDAATASRHM